MGRHVSELLVLEFTDCFYCNPNEQLKLHVFQFVSILLWGSPDRCVVEACTRTRMDVLHVIPIVVVVTVPSFHLGQAFFEPSQASQSQARPQKITEESKSNCPCTRSPLSAGLVLRNSTAPRGGSNKTITSHCHLWDPDSGRERPSPVRQEDPQ